MSWVWRLLDRVDHEFIKWRVGPVWYKLSPQKNHVGNLVRTDYSFRTCDADGKGETQTGFNIPLPHVPTEIPKYHFSRQKDIFAPLKLLINFPNKKESAKTSSFHALSLALTVLLPRFYPLVYLHVFMWRRLKLRRILRFLDFLALFSDKKIGLDADQPHPFLKKGISFYLPTLNTKSFLNTVYCNLLNLFVI